MHTNLSDIFVDIHGYFFQVIKVTRCYVVIRPIKRKITDSNLDRGETSYEPCPYVFNDEYQYWDIEDSVKGRKFKIKYQPNPQIEIDGDKAYLFTGKYITISRH